MRSSTASPPRQVSKRSWPIRSARPPVRPSASGPSSKPKALIDRRAHESSSLRWPLRFFAVATRAPVSRMRGARVGLAARLQAEQIARDGREIVAIVEPHIGVRLALGAAARRRRIGLAPRVAERLHAIGAHLHAGGGLVATEADERVAAAGERVVEARSGGAADRAAPLLAFEADHDRGSPEAGGDAPRDDADHARVPALPRQHDARLVPPAGRVDLGERVGEHLVLDGAALERELLDRGGDGHGGGRALLEEQRQREIGIAEPTGRVEARRDAEGDVLGADPGREIDARVVGQRAQAWAVEAPRAAPGHHREAGAHQGAVVAVERRHVGDGADGDRDRGTAADRARRRGRGARRAPSESAKPHEAMPL